MVPRSRKGGELKHNLFPWDDRPHSAWHEIFRHMTIQEVWDAFEEVHAKIFKSSGEFIIPAWWKVCPFVPKEAHIPKKPVARNFFLKAWHDCFGTKDLEKSRLLVKMMLLFFIFDGALYDGKEQISFNRLKLIIQRLRPGSQRFWAFTACFEEEPDGEGQQVLRITLLIQFIFSHSPYFPK